MNTKEKLKRILLEWAEFGIPQGYMRDFDGGLLKGPEILTIIGARRTGKTYLCYQLIQSLRESLPSGNVIYINFEDERLYPLQGDELTFLWDMCREVFQIDEKKRMYLFVDEIQNIKNWSKWARRITDQNRNMKLVITGSSSKLLSQELATELRGRTLSFKVFPLSFREYLGVKQKVVDTSAILYSRERPQIKKYFNEYFSSGGFPAVLDSPSQMELLREYYNAMFYRDMAERHKIDNLRLLEDYLTLLMDQVACDFSISMTAKKLNEFGYSFSKNTLSNFSRYAQDAFLIFETKKYSGKIREQMRASRKIYAIDHGLVQSVRFAFQENAGRLLENIAFLELQRRGIEVYYHKGIRECDFVTVERGRVSSAIQVTKTISAQKTREREIAGLTEAMEQHNLKKGLIITEDETEEIKVDSGLIKVTPLWHWLLEDHEKTS